MPTAAIVSIKRIVASQRKYQRQKDKQISYRILRLRSDVTKTDCASANLEIIFFISSKDCIKHTRTGRFSSYIS